MSPNAQYTFSDQKEKDKSVFVCTTVLLVAKCVCWYPWGDMLRTVLNVSPLVCCSDAHRPRYVTSHLPPPHHHHHHHHHRAHQVSMDEYFMSVRHTSPSKTKQSGHETDLKPTVPEQSCRTTRLHFQQCHADRMWHR